MMYRLAADIDIEEDNCGADEANGDRERSEPAAVEEPDRRDA